MSEENFDLVIRGQRILTRAGIAPREVGVRGGKIVAIEPLGNGLAGAEVIELADGRDPAPGPGGHPRPRQRARPHRVGGLRLRHPGGGRRRRDHHHRHAAELHPAHHHGGRPEAQARGGRGPGVRRRRLLGRRRSRATRRTCARCTTRASSASSASCCTPAWTSSRTWTPTRWRRTWRSSSPSTRS